MSDPIALATPLSEAEPAGPNLEYDPDFQALERAQAGRPEQVIGTVVKPGEEPDWQDVRERALALLARSRDLRVAVVLTRAQLKLEGLPGIGAGLALVRALLEQLWPSVHPQLDADDHDDPTFRVNSLLALAATDGLLKSLRETPVVQSRALGRFSLRDIRVIQGKLAPPAGTDPPQLAHLEAAFRDAGAEQLQTTAQAATAALGAIGAIDRLLMDKVGAEAPDLKPLSVDLADIKRLLDDRLGTAAPAGAQVPAAEDAPRPAPATGLPGDIASREDVVRMLERICDYYRRHEPSSPLPLLLQRAQRLVPLDFMAIVKDLTPAGVAEAESLAGVVKADQ